MTDKDQANRDGAKAVKPRDARALDFERFLLKITGSHRSTLRTSLLEKPTSN